MKTALLSRGLPALHAATAVSAPVLAADVSRAGGLTDCRGVTTVSGPVVASPKAGQIVVTNVASSVARAWSVTATRQNLSNRVTKTQNTAPNEKLLVTFTGLATGTNWNVSVTGKGSCDTIVTGGSIKVSAK